MPDEVVQRKTGGRSSYRPEYADQAFKLCLLLGATDEELARYFEVGNRSTIRDWRERHPEFDDAVRRGKDAADGEVAERLYRRAMGFSHPAVKIFHDAKTKHTEVVNYTEQYPPDTTACIFWLKNRQSAVWRDRREHTGAAGGPITLAAVDITQLTVQDIDQLDAIADRAKLPASEPEGEATT